MPSLPLHFLVAAVLSASASGFISKNTFEIAAPASRVFQTVTDHVGDWWDSEHTFSRNAHNLSIEARVGGCFCERFPAGGGVQHMTVVFLQPAKLLRLTGGLGPLQEMGLMGAMSWKFTEENSRTVLEVTYAVSGYQPKGVQQIAPAVDSVIALQIQRLKMFIETGRAEAK
jgi:uncharacterized protein YndB with AHSA1/START domain